MRLPDVPSVAQLEAVPAVGESTVLSATIEFSTVIVVPLAARRPPPAPVREPPSLPTIVESMTCVVFGVPLELQAPVPPHQLKIPPPWAELLPATVESDTTSVPAVPVIGFGP